MSTEVSPTAAMKETAKESKRDKLEISDAGSIVVSATSKPLTNTLETFQDLQKTKGTVSHESTAKMLADSNKSLRF